MNADLVRSKHIVIGVALAVALGVWAAVDLGGDILGGRPSRTFRLVSGWVAFVTMWVVAAYASRKYAHRLGYSPEFLMRTDYAAIEAATRALQRLEGDVQGASDKEFRSIEKRARARVREAGAHRVLKGTVQRAPSGEVSIKVGPTEPLGRVAGWMGVHIGYGILFAGAVVAHGGLASGSGLGLAMLLTSTIVIVTGVIGLYFWIFGPAQLTRAERDLSIEEAFALEEQLTRKVKRAGEEGGASHTHAELEVLRKQSSRVAAEHRNLRRIRWRMMAWKLVHVPSAIVLLVLVIVHVTVIWRY